MQRRNKNRTGRINEAVKEEMALILRDIKDPRIDMMTSVVKADTSRDLKYCKVYYSVLGDAEKKEATKEGLQSAAGFIRKQLAERLNLRVTPELTFIEDDSIEYSVYLEERIRQIHSEDEEKALKAGRRLDQEDEPEDSQDQEVQ